MSSFDDAAINYDAEFSHSAIGSRLRALVWRLLDRYIPDSSCRILEINCGTGEDAIHLARQGHQVVATDASSRMIGVAQQKERSGDIEFAACDFSSLGKTFNGRKFDVVFSDFGGLNCADEKLLKQTITACHELLDDRGLFIAVVMGTDCSWEKWYYGAKSDSVKKTRRKQKSGVETTIGDQRFKTYYYSPRSFEMFAGNAFRRISLHPVGFFLPPTYLEHYFKKHLVQLNLLSSLERLISSFSWLANKSDHYMIILQK